MRVHESRFVVLLTYIKDMYSGWIVNCEVIQVKFMLRRNVDVCGVVRVGRAALLIYASLLVKASAANVGSFLTYSWATETVLYRFDLTPQYLRLNEFGIVRTPGPH